MAVLPAVPPAASLAVLRAYAPEAALVRGGVQALLPHKIFNLGVPDILANQGLGAARYTGWRYLLRNEDGEYRVAEIAEDSATGRHAFVAFNSGGHVDAFVATHERISASAFAVAKDYEIAVLRAPACFVMAVWAGGVGHDGNVLVPLAPVHGNFEAGREYDAQGFVSTLERTAGEMTKVGRVERGGPPRGRPPRGNPLVGDAGGGADGGV